MSPVIKSIWVLSMVISSFIACAEVKGNTHRMQSDFDGTSSETADDDSDTHSDLETGINSDTQSDVEMTTDYGVDTDETVDTGSDGDMSRCGEGTGGIDTSFNSFVFGNGFSEFFLGGEPGNYNVSIRLRGESINVTAESRRFFGQSLSMDATTCFSFSVNVRSPEGQPLQDVDPGIDGLNLRLTGSDFVVEGIGVSPSNDEPVLYIAGDSTVCDQEPQLDASAELRYTGWGQLLPVFFRQGITVANYADSGEGTAAFRVDGGVLWQPIAEKMNTGDYLLIQLGHNDKTTDAATYNMRITDMVLAAKAAAVTPVLISPMVRNTGTPLEEQHIYGDLNVRSELIDIAQRQNVPFIDLMQMSDEWIASIGGQGQAGAYFVTGDMTHTNEVGAKIIAQLVVDGINASVSSLAATLR